MCVMDRTVLRLSALMSSNIRFPIIQVVGLRVDGFCDRVRVREADTTDPAARHVMMIAPPFGGLDIAEGCVI